MYRHLVRHFFGRFFEADSPVDQDQSYLRAIQWLAILSLPGLMISFFLLPDHPPGSILMAAAYSETERLWLRVGDRYVFVAYAMVAMGLLMTLKWDMLFPNKSDYLILTPLPIRSRQWFIAKVLALTGFVSLFVVAINLFSILLNFGIGHVAGTLGGSIFAALTVAAIQGVLINCLPPNVYRRVSPFVQATLIFLFITVLLITPLIKESIPLLARADSRLLDYFPMMWFLGLYESFIPTGTLMVRASVWSRTAVVMTAMMATVCTLSYLTGYRRYSRKILESIETEAFALSPWRSLRSALLDRILLRSGTERGVFHFIGSVSRRSNKHRLLTALFAGVGFALALSSLFVIDEKATAGLPFRVSLKGALEGPIILVFVMIAGLKTIFRVPYELQANWMFQSANVADAGACLRVVRKWVFVSRIVPVFILIGLFQFARFDWITAACQFAFDLILATLLFEAFFWTYDRVPFTCASSPSKLQMGLIAAGYLYGFTIYVEVAGGFKAFVTEPAALQLARPGRVTLLLGFFVLVCVLVRKYRATRSLVYVEDDPALLTLSFDSAYRRPNVRRVRDVKSWSTRQVVVAGFGAAILLLVTGFAFEEIGRSYDRRAFLQVGRSFDIGGRSMNISCLGRGSPIVILEADVAVAGYSWLQAQRQMATFSRVCWYDRSGYGWSDPGPFPNHSDSVAQDLHRLLHAAGVAPPYILVGHGMGAFHVRVYNGRYPGEAAGMVLVDPLNEDTTIHVHNHDENLRPTVISIAEVLGAFGLLRLVAPGPGLTPDSWTSHDWITATAMAWQPKSAVAHIHEPPLWISGELARQSGGLDALPLIVLSGEEHFRLFDGQNVALELSRHAHLAQRSSRGTHLVVPNSGYWNPYKTSKAVVEAVQDLIQQMRQPAVGAGLY